MHASFPWKVLKLWCEEIKSGDIITQKALPHRHISIWNIIHEMMAKVITQDHKPEDEKKKEKNQSTWWTACKCL